MTVSKKAQDSVPGNEKGTKEEHGTETAAAVRAPAGAAADAAASLLERLADRLGGRASVTSVYGEPVHCDGVTLIPVARTGFGFGAGTGREESAAKTGEGGGGGGGAGAKPLGFIEVKDGSAEFKPIHGPWTDLIVPLTGVLLGTVVPRLLRARGRSAAAQHAHLGKPAKLPKAKLPKPPKPPKAHKHAQHKLPHGVRP